MSIIFVLTFSIQAISSVYKVINHKIYQLAQIYEVFFSFISYTIIHTLKRKEFFMDKKILEYECPTCGGPLRFDIDTQMIVCEYCNNRFPEDVFSKKEDDTSETNDPKIDWNLAGYIKDHEQMTVDCSFSCTSCGAEVLADSNTAATECMYCGSPLLVTNNVTGTLKPDLIIPFKLDKAAAEKKLKQFYMRKILLPNAFKDRNKISKITGMYVPFWLFSANGSGDVTFSARKVNKHRDGDYIITTTKYYSAFRSGNVKFIKVPVDASNKMEDNYMDGLEPYNYEELTPFSNSYMAGFFSDKFDMDVNACSKRALTRITNSTNEAFKKTVTGYSSVSVSKSNISMSDRKIHYVLLPVWMLNTKYDGKMYKFAINGQTGKVSGDLPIDKRKKKIISVALFLINLAILALGSYNIFT